MEISLRPWLTTGVALVGAGAIAMAPINPITATPMMTAPAAVSTTVHAAAFELPYILTLPIVRQDILNRIDYWVIYLNGLAQAGAGAFDTLVALPQTAITITQQLLQLDFVGAFDTFTTAVRDGVIAVGQPLLDSLIQRNQMALVIQTALQSAGPAAFFSVVNGVLAAGSGVTTSVIEGTQNLVNAFLTFNLSNIVNAAIDGTQGFVQALGAGAGDIVTGIEGAQHLISDALAQRPTTEVATAAAAMPDLTTKTVTLTVDPPNSPKAAPTTSADTESALPGLKKVSGLAPTAKRSVTTAAPGSAVAAASKRAAHDTSGAPRKAKESKG
ncbi:hypothetical protein BH09ACT8_BH09ACT8_17210 [soil metagenome]